VIDDGVILWYFLHAVKKAEGGCGKRIGNGRIGPFIVTVIVALLQWRQSERFGQFLTFFY